MSIAEKLTAIADNVQKIYDAGKKAGGFDWAAFWNRPHFQYAFWRWQKACYTPPADYVIKGVIRQAFVGSTITDTLIPIEGTGDCSYAFQNCTELVNIPSLNLSGATDVGKMFSSCSQLVSIGFVGIIRTSGLDFSPCPKLNRTTLLSLVNRLEAKTDGGEWIVTLGSSNKAKLSAEELKIAEDKGWEIT